MRTVCLPTAALPCHGAWCRCRPGGTQRSTDSETWAAPREEGEEVVQLQCQFFIPSVRGVPLTQAGEGWVQRGETSLLLELHPHGRRLGWAGGNSLSSPLNSQLQLPWLRPPSTLLACYSLCSIYVQSPFPFEEGSELLHPSWSLSHSPQSYCPFSEYVCPSAYTHYVGPYAFQSNSSFDQWL